MVEESVKVNLVPLSASAVWASLTSAEEVLSAGFSQETRAAARRVVESRFMILVLGGFYSELGLIFVFFPENGCNSPEEVSGDPPEEDVHDVVAGSIVNDVVGDLDSFIIGDAAALVVADFTCDRGDEKGPDPTE